MNILTMARAGLRLDLTTALHKAVSLKEPMRHLGLRIKTNGDFEIVNLTVQPVPGGPDSDAAARLFLVIFEDAPAAGPGRSEKATTLDAGERADENAANVDVRIATLKQELRAKEEYLQTTNEELETSNEELKSANEEMQSVNEVFGSRRSCSELVPVLAGRLGGMFGFPCCPFRRLTSSRRRWFSARNRCVSATSVSTRFSRRAMHSRARSSAMVLRSRPCRKAPCNGPLPSLLFSPRIHNYRKRIPE